MRYEIHQNDCEIWNSDMNLLSEWHILQTTLRTFLGKVYEAYRKDQLENNLPAKEIQSWILDYFDNMRNNLHSKHLIDLFDNPIKDIDAPLYVYHSEDGYSVYFSALDDALEYAIDVYNNKQKITLVKNKD